MKEASMKAQTILTDLIGLLSGALARIEDIDLTLGAVRDTAEEIEDGICGCTGVDRASAGTLADILTVERSALRAVTMQLAVARMQARSLAPSLKTRAQLEHAVDSCGGEGVITIELEA